MLNFTQRPLKIKDIIKQALKRTGVTLLLTLAAPIVMAGNIGVLVLYKDGGSAQHDGILQQVSSNAEKVNCTVQRQGAIEDTQGGLDIEEPNYFLLVQCEKSLLKNGSSELFSPLSGPVGNLVIAEGPMLQFGKFSRSEAVKDRAYIIKLSQYNNVHPSKREADFMTIDKLVDKRVHRYRSEAFIHVTRAQGMVRPDEVVVLYYDTPDDGNQFRKNNPDILNKIGQFNDEHLLEYSYFSGTPTL